MVGENGHTRASVYRRAKCSGENRELHDSRATATKEEEEVDLSVRHKTIRRQVQVVWIALSLLERAHTCHHLERQHAVPTISILAIPFYFCG